MNDFYEIKTASATEPITLPEAKAFGRDIDSTDDDIVTGLIEAARFQLESMTNRVFVTRTFTGKFTGFCESAFEDLLYVELRRSPLISVVSVKINGDLQTVTTDYLVKEKSGFSRVLFQTPATSITLDVDDPYPIEIEFTAGYGAAADVPENILTSVKQLVLFWYENRGDVSTDKKQLIPFVVRQIMKQYRIVNSYG